MDFSAKPAIHASLGGLRKLFPRRSVTLNKANAVTEFAISNDILANVARSRNR